MEGKLNCPDCKLELKDSVKNYLNSLEREMKSKIRSSFSLKISSGARCLKYNKLIGGEENSAHLIGLAADLKIDSNFYAAIIINHLIHLYNPNKIRMGYGLKNGIIILHFDLAAGLEVPYPTSELKYYPSPRFWGY